RVRKGVSRRAAGLDRRRRRCELDARVRARRREALDPRRASRGGAAQRRSHDAGGDQPRRDGRGRGSLVDTVAGWRRESARGRRAAGEDRARRQHHDRLVRAAEAEDPLGGDAREARPRAARIRRRDAASPVERRSSREARDDRRAARRGRADAAVGVPGASAHAAAPRRVRSRRAACGEHRNSPDGALVVRRVHEPRRRQPARRDGFGRRAGGDELPRHSVPHATREHRAAGHRDPGDESADRARRARCRDRGRDGARRRRDANPALGRTDGGAGRGEPAAAGVGRLRHSRLRLLRGGALVAPAPRALYNIPLHQFRQRRRHLVKVRTRFAPSPTGYLHIGSVRTALYAWLYARHHGGEYILRIEDTDRERSTQAAVDAILDGLAWLGLDSDEPPVYQTQRFPRYAEVIERMLAEGTAYRCYCTKEEIEAMRAAAQARGEKPRYDGRCRAGDRYRPDVPPVVRFKNPLEGEVVVDDLVKGRIVFANSELDDL